MAEMILRVVASHGKGERTILPALRLAGQVLTCVARAVLGAAHWIVRLASPGMQTWISGRGSTGLPGNPWPGAWAGMRTSGKRSSLVR
jgi:hypothetical protein